MRDSCCAMVAPADSIAASCARRSCSFSIRLAKPRHRRTEQDEHAEAHADGPERDLRVVRDDLVDHDLGEERRGEAGDLEGEGGGEHVAPDALVAQELGHKPAKAKSPGRRSRGVRIRGVGQLARGKQELRLEGGERFCDVDFLRAGDGGVEHQQCVAFAAGDDGGHQRGRVPGTTKADAWERRCGG
jgi:hypothetical protein